MQKAALLLAACFSLFISCNHLTTKTIQGEGPLTTEERSAGSFDQVQSFGSFDVTISSGQNSAVKVEAESNLQPYIEVTSDNNTVNIRQKKNYNIHSPNGIRITVTTPSLRALRQYGSGTIKTNDQISSPDHLEIESSGSGDITYDLKASSTKAHVSGSGNLNLSGSTDDLDAGINGSGNIRARNLQANKTTVNISGSGTAEVTAKEKLSADITGSGDVRYWGSPEVNSHIAGSGTVSKQNN